MRLEGHKNAKSRKPTKAKVRSEVSPVIITEEETIKSTVATIPGKEFHSLVSVTADRGFTRPGK
jgi:hypothetical protein